MRLQHPPSPQEEFYGRPIILADRDSVEQGADDILAGAGDAGCNVALLVVGDPFGATTHTDFLIRAREQKIPYQVFFSLLSANLFSANFFKVSFQSFNYLGGAQCVDHERDRLLRPAAVPIRRDDLDTVLDGQLAAGQFLRQNRDEHQVRLPHAGAAR